MLPMQGHAKSKGRNRNRNICAGSNKRKPPYNSDYQLQYMVDSHLAMLDRSVWINSFKRSERGEEIWTGECMEMQIMRWSCRRGIQCIIFQTQCDEVTDVPFLIR